MRGFLLSNVVMFAVACGGPARGPQSPSAPAQDAKRQAERGEIGVTPETGGGAAPAIACGDTVLNDQHSSGGEQLTQVVACTYVDPVQTPARPIPAPEPDPSEAIPPPPVAAEPPPLPPVTPKKAVTPATPKR